MPTNDARGAHFYLFIAIFGGKIQTGVFWLFEKCKVLNFAYSDLLNKRIVTAIVFGSNFLAIHSY